MFEKQEGFMHCTLLQVTSYHGPGGLDLIDQCRCILDIFIVGVQQFLSILQLFVVFAVWASLPAIHHKYAQVALRNCKIVECSPY